MSVLGEGCRCGLKSLIFLPIEVPNVLRIHVVCIVYPVNILMGSQKFCFGKSDGILKSNELHMFLILL
jgi:hypothetical protein